MSKIICDVCGTTYAETSAQCPICGSARKSVDQTAAGEGNSYAYVRGGRFSKSNVRKRNRTGKDFTRQAPAASAPAKKTSEPAKPAKRREPEVREEDTVVVNKGLIVVVVILLLAIIAVTGYIVAKFVKPGNNPGNRPKPPATTTTAPQQEQTTPQTIPCTELTLSSTTIEFTEAGNSWLLNAEKTPANSTDEIVFASSDENVVTVTDTGYITAVGGGEAVITVTCGNVQVQCTVVCSFAGGTTTEPTEPTDPEFVFEFNTKYVDESTGKHDATLDGPGKTWRAYKTTMTIDPADIQWSVDDESICTIHNGIVTAVARGKTEIHATYGGKTYTCIIRCSWVEETEPTEPEVTEPTEPEVTEPTEPEVTEPTEPEVTEPTEPEVTEPTEPEEKKVSISHEDVTLLLSSGTEYDRSFNLRLKDGEGNALEVEWTADVEGIVTIEGNKITAAGVGKVNISCTYEGVTYTCVVYVRE
jgi:hypothetical protein